MEENKYLPIGTVVLLNGGSKKVMITGFCVIPNDNKHKLYDYSGCLYPEGIINSNEVCLFNHEQIEEISFKGYENEEEKVFKEELAKEVNNIQVDTDHNIIDDPSPLENISDDDLTSFSINDNIFG